MFPNWLAAVSIKRMRTTYQMSLRMHGTKDVGHYQATRTSVGVELRVSAVWSSANPVKGDRTLNCGVDTPDNDFNKTPVAVW